MKTIFLTLSFFFFIAYYAIGQTWNQHYVKEVINHIKKHGEQSADQIKMTLPDGGSINLIGDEVIGIKGEDFSFWFFVKEPCNFKGNLADCKYLFRFSQIEQNLYIEKAERFLIDFTQKKPIPLVPLWQGTDELSKDFFSFYERLKSVGQKNDDGYEYRDYDITPYIVIGVQTNIMGNTIIKDYSGEQRLFIICDNNRPLLDGYYYNDMNEKVSVSETLLRKIFRRI
jgi:hypothetical protein